MPEAEVQIGVVFAGPGYVVVDKPAGMLSVPGKGEGKRDCVAARVAAMFPQASGPLIVHRLDMETSGLMVLGLDAPTQRALSMQFERRDPEKRYLALVEGIVEGDAGTIDVPIRPDVGNRPMQIVDRIDGREARTKWRVLSREVDRTRVEFRPMTGRTHQIRVHASLAREQGGLGHPILGDVLYGDGAPAPRLMLHAAGLSFLEPERGGRVQFESPAPF